ATIGAALRNNNAREIARLRANVGRLMARSSRTPGSDGGSGISGVMEHARMALARVDSIKAMFAEPRSSFGRFRRDSTLQKTVADVRDQLDEIRARLASPDGTLGRTQTDSALTRAVSVAREEMDALLADIRRRPL